MLRSRKRRVFVSLLTVLIMLASGFAVFAAGSTVSISGHNVPESIKKGSSYSIRGTLSSNVNIARVEVGIAKSKTKWTSYKYDNQVNAKTFDLRKADSKLKFGKLSKGTYYYRIFAHTSDGKVHTVLNQKFTVSKKSSSSGNGASASNVKYPSTLVQGKGFSVSGKIKSSKKIKSVTAGVVNAGNGSWTSVKATKSGINSKSFKLSKLDSKLKFGTLPVGEYRYRITVKTTKGTSTVVDSYFSVAAAPAAPAAPAAASSTPAPAASATPAPAAASAPAATLKVINSKPVTIAHAAHGEKGTSGCKAGDQTGTEVCTRTWTYSSKSSSGFHWNVVLRCNNPNVAAEIAKTALAACKNNHIGYDKGTVASRQSFYKALVAANWDASAITTDVETSCSPFACACINAGFKSQYIKTDHSCTTLAKTLRNDPMFTYLTADEYCKSYKYLMPGDILITTGHHCAIVVK